MREQELIGCMSVLLIIQWIGVMPFVWADVVHFGSSFGVAFATTTGACIPTAMWVVMVRDLWRTI